jgi:hypothetical protein
MSTQAPCNGEREPKRAQKKVEKGSTSLGVSQLPFFASFFVHFFFSISPELRVGPRSFRFPTLFVLLIGKGKKTRAKNEENGKKGEKGWQKGREKGQL